MRPSIHEYQDGRDFLLAMSNWVRTSDPHFSLRKKLRLLGSPLSPSLVSQICHRKRQLNRDHLPVLKQLFNLRKDEVNYLDQTLLVNKFVEDSPRSQVRAATAKPKNHLLSDWLNVYVKDACRLATFTEDPKLIQRLLGGMATPKRIQKSLNFLIREGFLRRTMNGRLVEDQQFETTTDEIPNDKIRTFHRKALQIASDAIQAVPVSEREAFTLVMPLNEQSVPQLKELLKRFRHDLLEFLDQHPNETERLCQVVINFCPLGGPREPIP